MSSCDRHKLEVFNDTKMVNVSLWLGETDNEMDITLSNSADGFGVKISDEAFGEYQYQISQICVELKVNVDTGECKLVGVFQDI